MCGGYSATESSRHASCFVGSLNNSAMAAYYIAAYYNDVKCAELEFCFAICDSVKSDLGDLMESLKYASIINYEVVYLFRFSSIFSLVTSVH